MLKRPRHILLCVLLWLLAAGCGEAVERDEVVVFAAASLRDALMEVGAAFEAETGTAVVFNFAGSNVLAQQIGAAGGADVFFSASERWMDAVADAGRVMPGTRVTVLSNTLAIVAHPSSRWTLATPCDLATLDFQYLALGDPDAVPAGTYARAWLAAQPCADGPLWDQLERRIAPAPDVRSALSLVRADPDLVGIVYKTDVRAFAADARLLYEVPPSAGPAIRYVLARLTDAPHPEAAARFHAFLTGTAAQRIFSTHGFTPLE